MLKSTCSRPLVIYGCSLHRTYPSSTSLLLSRPYCPKSSKSLNLQSAITSRHLSANCNRFLGNKETNSDVNTSAPSARQLSTETRKLDPLDLTFRNTKQAYKSKTTYELLRAIFVLKISQFDILVYNHAVVQCTTTALRSYFSTQLTPIPLFIQLTKFGRKVLGKKIFHKVQVQ